MKHRLIRSISAILMLALLISIPGFTNLVALAVDAVPSILEFFSSEPTASKYQEITEDQLVGFDSVEEFYEAAEASSAYLEKEQYSKLDTREKEALSGKYETSDAVFIQLEADGYDLEESERYVRVMERFSLEKDALLAAVETRVALGKQEEALQNDGLDMEEAVYDEAYSEEELEASYRTSALTALIHSLEQLEILERDSEVLTAAEISILQGYILGGKSFLDAYNALIASRVMAKDLSVCIEEPAIMEVPDARAGQSVIASREGSVGTASVEAEASLAEDYHVKSDILSDYMEANDLTEEDIDVLFTEESMLVANATQSSPSQSSSSSGVLDPSLFRTPSDLKEAPQSFDADTQISVDMMTGEYTYTETDLYLPGKNGFDLTLTRKYDSSRANAETTFFYMNSSRLYTDIYELRLGVYWWDDTFSVASPANYINPSQYAGSNGNYIRQVASEYGLAEGNISFSIAALPFMLEVANSGYHVVVFGDFKVLVRPEIITKDSAMSSAVTLHTIPINEREMDFGVGWAYDFPYVEYRLVVTYDFGIESEYYVPYLHLPDGRSFVIYNDYSADETYERSGLESYTFEDIIVHLNYVNGQKQYVVFYQDGQIDTIDNRGRIIKMEDKYGNEITFAYSNGNVTITDTMERQVLLEKTSSTEKVLKILNPSGENEIVRTYTMGQPTHGATTTIRTLREVQEPSGTKIAYTSKWASKAFNPVAPTSSTFYGTYPLVALTGAKRLAPNSTSGGSELFEISSSINAPSTFGSLDGLQKVGALGYEVRLRTIFYYVFEGPYVVFQDGLNTDKRKTFKSNSYSYGGDYNGFQTRYGNTYGFYLNETSRYYLTQRESGVQSAENSSSRYEYNAQGQLITEMHNINNLIQDQTQGKAYRLLSMGHHPYSVANYEYYTYGDQEGLLKKKTETIYDVFGGTSASKTNTYQYEYDIRKNVTKYTDPQGLVTTNSYFYKPVPLSAIGTHLTMQTGTTYKMDASTTIAEVYTLAADNLSVASVEIKENGVTMEKTGYEYDTYGNAIKFKSYNNAAFTTWDETQYTYPNGGLLSQKTFLGIKDADGTDIPANAAAGSSAGQIVEKYTYDNWGRPLTVMDGNGNTTSYEYESGYSWNVSKLIHPDSSYVTYDRTYYSSDTALLENGTTELLITNENGEQFRYVYNQLGDLLKTIDVETGIVLSESVYDHMGRLYQQKVTLNSGNVTTEWYHYDALGRIREKDTYSSTGNLLASERYEYIDVINGTQSKVIKTVVGDNDAPSVITVEYYDRMGNKVKSGYVSNGVEYCTVYTYDYLGNVKSKTLPGTGSATTSYTYDYAGRVKTESNPVSGTATTTYNQRGQVVSFTDFKNSTTTYTYDVLGRIMVETMPFDGTDVSVKKYEYDNVSNVIEEKVTNQAPGATVSYSKTAYEHNNRNLLELTISYNGNTPESYVKYEYDGVGNLTMMYTGMTSATPNANAALTQYEYDRFGNLSKKTDPLGRAETYAYNLAGILISKVDRNGAVTSNTIDGLGRILTTTATKNQEITGQRSTAYTVSGAVKSTSNGALTTTYGYDETGLVILESDTLGAVKHYTYTATGNRASFLYVQGGTTKQSLTYEYDSLDRLVTVKESGTSRATYAYDANGNRTSLTYPGAGLVETYTYNQANLVTSVINKSGSNTLSSYAYTYYLDGNQRAKVDHAGKVTSYTYDGLGRLTEEKESGGIITISTISYAFDSFSNRSEMTVTGTENYSVSYTYDKNNRLLATEKETESVIDISSYQYDRNGNTISVLKEVVATSADPGQVALSGSGYEFYAYDGFNQMVSYEADGLVTSYTYRPDGLRLTKTTDGVEVLHVWDGQNLIADLTDGVITGNYVRGINLIAADQSGSRQYYLYNAHGDVMQLASSIGVLLQTYEYDAFGNEKDPQEGDENPFRYCGEYWDEETETYYLRARYYAPTTGRFLAEDPHWNPTNMIYLEDGAVSVLSIMQSRNLYVFCLYNPIMLVDPSGEDALFLTDTEGAYGAGHSAIMMQDKNGTWWFASFEGTNKNNAKLVFAKVENVNFVNGRMVTASKNRDAAYYKVGKTTYYLSQYDRQYRIYGDYSASVTKARYYEGKRRESYSVHQYNCVWVALEILQVSTSGDLYRRIDRKLWAYGANGTRMRNTLVPNWVHNDLSSIFK